MEKSDPFESLLKLNFEIAQIEINKALYTPGKDRRGNLCDQEHMKNLTPIVSKIEQQAQSVACLMLADKLKKLSSDHYQLQQTMTLAKRIEGEMKIPLGEKEAFRNEPAPGFGTAFFIGKKFAITAAHCVCLENSENLDTERIKKTRLVFNFKMKEKNQCENIFNAADVYAIKKVVFHQCSKKQTKWVDWALLKLDRIVEGRKPLEVSYAQKVAKDVKLYMLGHPSGLPLKLTKEGIVTHSLHLEYFSCYLDAFSGNSGSPVFDLLTQKVIGILCGGGEDYEVTHNYKQTGTKRIQAHRVENGSEKCQRVNTLLLELDRYGALEKRQPTQKQVEEFLVSLKNKYKRQKNIPRLLHSESIPIDAIYTQLVLIEKDAKNDNKDNKDKEIYQESRINGWEDVQGSKKAIDLDKLFELQDEKRKEQLALDAARRRIELLTALHNTAK